MDNIARVNERSYSLMVSPRGEKEWKIEWSSTRNTVGWIDATAVEVKISKVRFFSKTRFPNWSKWRTRLSNHLRPIKCYSLSLWSGSPNDKFPFLIKKIFHQNEIYASFFFPFFFKLQDNNAFIGILPTFSLF